MPQNRRPIRNLGRVGRAALRAIAGLGLLTVLLVVGLRWWTDRDGRHSTYSAEEAPTAQVAIVFGAGVWPDGSPSAILGDRVETAVTLYRLGKVQKLLMTGDNSTLYYNEPQAMREYALERGVPDEDIVLDYAGRRTYDSCYRARHIFLVSDAILVTQSYHLDRALFTAKGLGLRATGVAADRRDYVFIVRYWWRELLATPVAWWEVHVSRPLPIMGEPLPIFPAEGEALRPVASG
ncbi:MAG: DUF218 domain-containing protein [Chloroflexi bacterium]|nr:DUF218 domain-containing protein [Chloroflexota bacterium]